MSIRRLSLQRLSYLVSYSNVFFINRSRLSKEIFLTVKEVVTWRGNGIIADLCTPSVKSIPNDESLIRKFFLSSTFKLWWPSGRKKNQGSVYGNWKSEFSRHPGVWVFLGSEVWVFVTPHLFMSLLLAVKIFYRKKEVASAIKNPVGVKRRLQTADQG